MNLTVRFFASLREQLGTAELQVSVGDAVQRVADLIAALAAQHGERWGELLSGPRVIVARNREVATREARLCDGDEIAFYPPVTGG
jgi:molybdopterin synthase sulfur carrier subunit